MAIAMMISVRLFAGDELHFARLFFFLALFSDEKRGKSHLRGFSSLLKNTLRVHELVARAMRCECVRHGLMEQVADFALPAAAYRHACEHITRESRADSCTHCLHARYKCRAGVNKESALTG